MTLFDSSLQVKGSYKVEVEKFEKSQAFSKMMARVNSRVGLQLDKEEARLMWNICRWDILRWKRSLNVLPTVQVRDCLEPRRG